MSTYSQGPTELAKIWDDSHTSKILPSDVRNRDLKTYLDGLKKQGVKVDEVGRSKADREIYQLEFGHGKTRVFMWSQMHGDEPTATSALIDMFAYLQSHPETAWVKDLAEKLTIRAVPMLNPDGAELYQRRNLQGIDINRDAINLKTPEARLLKNLRDGWSPEIGFNLHNQNALTTAGNSANQAAISLLVVYGDAAKTSSAGHERNRRLCAAIVDALQMFIPGHISRYDDEYTSTAFGDNFSAWGTPVILIETGALQGKDEMFLVKMNFVAYLTALANLANGNESKIATASYDGLPENTAGRIYNFVFRNATVFSGTQRRSTRKVSIGINSERRRASLVPTGHITAIGDLGGIKGLIEFDASDYSVAPKSGRLKVGAAGNLLFYKKERQIDWAAPDLEKAFPPDAAFASGIWTIGEGLLN